MENIIDVVAAVIWRDGKFLICQRPRTKARALLWEFVGGKVEARESKEEALARECKEELDIDISVGREVMSVLHEYPDINIRLTLFDAKIERGCPRLLEHNDLRWITPYEIPQYNFCPADDAILKHLAGRRL